MNHATTLRQLLAREDQSLIVPGAGTPIEALAIERVGFEAVYLSGYAIAAWRHGLPDIGLLGAGELMDALGAVRRVSNLPVIVDADTCYGDVTSVYANVRLLEAAGAAAIQIEDQVWPKKCGHMVGKEVIDADEAVRKVATALDARRDPSTVIIARTDALGPRGIDEAIARALRFADAGADIVFLDAPGSREDLARIGQSVPGLLMANVSEGGRTPTLAASDFHELGFQLVIYPTTPLRLAAKSIDDFLGDLRREGDSLAWRERMYGLEELNELVGLEEYLVVGDRENARRV
ncbi:MAG TPA: isocitrate lyase/phosphoenolpyruvate mutase family protein [Acidimicrobiales bacterium]|nr:isocitrate lyase/phosphoenolpyruvate mutase family protein [Acidimicrobiales bacterium]